MNCEFDTRKMGRIFSADAKINWRKQEKVEQYLFTVYL